MINSYNFVRAEFHIVHLGELLTKGCTTDYCYLSPTFNVPATGTFMSNIDLRDCCTTNKLADGQYRAEGEITENMHLFTWPVLYYFNTTPFYVHLP